MNQPETSEKTNEKPFREGCAFLSGEDFGLFSIQGKDAKDFLHRIVSNEIRNLPEGTGTPVCLLNPQGRVELYFHLWRVGEEYRVLICGNQRETFIPKLDRFLFTEEVRFEDRSDRDSVLVLCGPNSAGTFEQAFGQAVSTIETLHSGEYEGVGGARVYRFDWARVPVYALNVSSQDAPGIKTRLLEAGADEGDWSTFHTLRIEQGTPWPEFEVESSAIPYECGLEEAVSLTKGCFVGQEIVARMSNLGESPRYLRGLVFEGATIPPQGAKVMSGEVKAGRILTAGYSARLGAAIATSSLLKNLAEPETTLEVEGERAKVKAFPL